MNEFIDSLAKLIIQIEHKNYPSDILLNVTKSSIEAISKILNETDKQISIERIRLKKQTRKKL
jgi:hypothetical protein